MRHDGDMEASVVVVRWSRIPVDDHTQNTTRARREESNRLAVLTASALLGKKVTPSGLTRRCSACGSRTHGRPELVLTAPDGALGDRGAPPALSVSIARGRDVAVAAVAHASGTHAIGIDLECVGEALSPGFATVLMADEERAKHATSDQALLRTWVRKESVVKAIGTGLATDPREIVLDGLDLTSGPDGPWRLVDLDIDPDVLATLAIRGAKSARFDVDVALS